MLRIVFNGKIITQLVNNKDAHYYLIVYIQQIENKKILIPTTCKPTELLRVVDLAPKA